MSGASVSAGGGLGQRGVAVDAQKGAQVALRFDAPEQMAHHFGARHVSRAEQAGQIGDAEGVQAAVGGS